MKISFKEYENSRKYYTLNAIMRGDSLVNRLLDSSLIKATKLDYNVKIIECGDYIQLYKYKDLKVLKNKDNKVRDKKIDNDYLFKNKNELKNKNDLKKIEYKNIMRSKFQLQRIIKSNENIFKSFITLTFAENIKDINVANNKFRSWRTYIKRIKPSFKYVCVPEFQKRGAVHYHLLTNLDISIDSDVIIPQKNKKNQYDVKGWGNGFTSVFPMKNINVVGYLSKYMTKDIDNRLFGRNRYFTSRDLIMPKEIKINCDNGMDLLYLLRHIQQHDLKYKNDYLDVFNNVIEFSEYKIKK